MTTTVETLGSAPSTSPAPPAANALSGRPPRTEGLGDVDGDGEVTMDDAELVLNIAVGNVDASDDERRRADVSGSGEVTSHDSSLIQQYIEGDIDDFPAEGGGGEGPGGINPDPGGMAFSSATALTLAAGAGALILMYQS